MDLASNDDCSRLTVINNWRVYFKIILISDLVNAEGNKVDSIYLQFPRQDQAPQHPNRISNLQWPNQGKPSERSFTYWKTYVCSVVNCDPQGNLRKKLGRWNVCPTKSINTWLHYHTYENDLLSYNKSSKQFSIAHNKQLKRTKGKYFYTDYIRATAETAYPTTVLVTNAHTEVMYVQNKLNKISNTIIQQTDFNTFISTQEPWVQRILSMWWTVPTLKIQTFLRDEDEIIVVSDGGMITPKGSYGVVIGTKDKAIKATVEGHVKGSPISMTSFRCEAYGMLASFVFIKQLCNFFQIQGHSRKITYFCDGLSLLKRISYNRYRKMVNKDYLRDDIDLELQILEEYMY
jgi:hypothetical protein